MDTQTDILNIFVSRLISSPAHDEAIQSLIKIFDEVIIRTRCLPNFDIPYDDITELIYDYSQDINLYELDLMMGELEGRYQEIYPFSQDGQKHPNHKCLTKFRRHIYLAATQKNYINKITQQEAKTARNIANSAQEISRKAEKLSIKAEMLAQKSEQLATDADNQAKSTIANYISILGIFASIIFTLFGGFNLISSTVKLLETSSRLPYLVFIISLLMICLLTLLNMMVKWVNSVSNLKNALEGQINNATQGVKRNWWEVWKWDFYTKAVSVFLIATGLSLAGMYFVKKEPFFSFTKEVTSEVKESQEIGSKLEPKENPETLKNTETSKGSGENDQEVKIIKTLTISNQPNRDNDDKKEDE